MNTSILTAFNFNYWLKFPNQFNRPEQSNFLWKKLGCFSIPVGLSNYGMCGGVASVALDFFYNQKLPPKQNISPSSKDNKPLFELIKQRQVDSISLIDFWRYFTLMFTNSKTDKDERNKEWKQIKSDIQEGKPVLLGLQMAKIDKWYKIHQITNIVKNHQVIAWGFEEEKETVYLRLYDPNAPHIENMTLSFQKNSEDSIKCSPFTIGSIYTFFKTSYKPQNLDNYKDKIFK